MMIHAECDPGRSGIVLVCALCRFTAIARFEDGMTLEQMAAASLEHTRVAHQPLPVRIKLDKAKR